MIYLLLLHSLFFLEHDWGTVGVGVVVVVVEEVEVGHNRLEHKLGHRLLGMVQSKRLDFS